MADRSSRGRGRGRRGRQINRDTRRRGGRGRGGGQYFFGLNDRVMALWEPENKYYRATISSVHWDGTFGVVFDMENDREYLGQKENLLQPIKQYNYKVDQKVKALFVKNDRWHNAIIKADEGNSTFKIKFLHLDKEFSQRAEYLRPVFSEGTRILALWFKEAKYLPATIKKGDEKNGNYTIQFDSRKNEFSGQRPDNIIPLEDFEKGEEVLALWGQDGLYYPAVVTDKVFDSADADEEDKEEEEEEEADDDAENDEAETEAELVPSYLIRFHGMTKQFSARAYNLKKMR